MGFDHVVMQAVQSLYGLGGAVMDKLFLFFTFFGEESFALLFIFFIYWCYDKMMGEYMILSMYTAIGLNGMLKDIVRRPRPFLNEAYSNMRYVKTDGLLVNTSGLSASFSFPSGHSQTAGSMFAALSVWKRKTWITAVGILLTLGVMTSRVYLGVHYPTDVLAGAALGTLISLAAYPLFRRFYEHRLLLFGAALLIVCSALIFDPTSDTLKTIGLGAGAFIGIAMDIRFLRFRVDGTRLRKALRLILGAAVLVGLRVGLKALFPVTIWFDCLRYAVLGFAAAFLWPLVFTKLRL